MKNIILILSVLFLTQIASAQNFAGNYPDSIKEYRFKYVNTHEVVKTLEDRKLIQFFEPDSNYRVVATFEKIYDPNGFKMPTSAKSMQQYYRYGKIFFALNDHPCQLFVYQSKDMILTDEYKDYLFIPFTDATNGTETYEGGRYIDIMISDIDNNYVVIDFNKAYNPYCCYASGYHCPIPPAENNLKIPVNAGEKKYLKAVY